ncbi:hypothetical protein KCU83_g657, partial [Aureobasidium melanogenum]
MSACHDRLDDGISSGDVVRHSSKVHLCNRLHRRPSKAALGEECGCISGVVLPSRTHLSHHRRSSKGAQSLALMAAVATMLSVAAVDGRCSSLRFGSRFGGVGSSAVENLQPFERSGIRSDPSPSSLDELFAVGDSSVDNIFSLITSIVPSLYVIFDSHSYWQGVTTINCNAATLLVEELHRVLANNLKSKASALLSIIGEVDSVYMRLTHRYCPGDAKSKMHCFSRRRVLEEEHERERFCRYCQGHLSCVEIRIDWGATSRGIVAIRLDPEVRGMSSRGGEVQVVDVVLDLGEVLKPGGVTAHPGVLWVKLPLWTRLGVPKGSFSTGVWQLTRTGSNAVRNKGDFKSIAATVFAVYSTRG